MNDAAAGLATPGVCRKRAYSFLADVEKATEDFRQRALAYNAQVNESDAPFLQGMVNTVRGGRQLKQQKGVLVNDLNLASDETEKAAKLDPQASIETRDGVFGVVQFRAMIQYRRGEVEMVYGSPESAKQFFNSSLAVTEFADAHYMLGLLYESEYKSAEALQHFERCLELEPAGELSVPALREVNAMRGYKKKFRGSWLLLIILLMFPVPFVGGVLSFFAKRK